ncbi:MAG: GNAT family N-acetyltransferase [Bryocella sp.]
MPASSTPVLRRATIEDALQITQHRHQMFADNGFAPEDRLKEMDHAFEPWLRSALADGSYLGLLLEDESHILAGAGIYFMPFPPHWIHDEPRRAYLLNVYVVPEARNRGFASQLLQACLAICRDKNIAVVTLHASPQGRPIYEKLGFEPSDEMMLRLRPES